MYQNIPTKVLTGECRLSFVNVVTPRQSMQGGDPKYSVTLLIPKSDTATLENIRASMDAAKQAAIGTTWGGVCPPSIKSVLHDGDGVRPSGETFGPECKGHWVITASSKTKPQVVGQDNIKTELLPSDIYSGMYARVTINFYGYSNSGNKGVACGLGNIMKTRDGEPLSYGASAVYDFAEVGNSFSNQAYTAGMPAVAQYAPPQQAYVSPQQNVSINPLTGQPM